MKDRAIQLTPEGPALVEQETLAPIWQVTWLDVKQIAAWKLDIWSTDMICMGFRISAEPKYFWCDEECTGWKELQKEIERRFAVNQGWWSKIAFPAFVANWTTVWGEDIGCENITLLPRRPYHGKGFPVDP